MKHGVTTWSEPVQHQMDVTYLDHRSTRCHAALIVLAISPVTPMPGIRSLNHPALLQGREAFRFHRLRLHCDAPICTMLGDPRFEGVIVILIVSKDGDQTWKILGLDLSEQGQGRHAILQA